MFVSLLAWRDEMHSHLLKSREESVTERLHHQGCKMRQRQQLLLLLLVTKYTATKRKTKEDV